MLEALSSMKMSELPKFSVATGSSPEVEILHDVVALPGKVGLYDLNGHRIDAAHFRTLGPDAPASLRQRMYTKTPETTCLPTDLETFQAPVFYGGALVPHYGHFIIDSMSRLWARDDFSQLPILFLFHDGWKTLPSYGQSIFKSLDLLGRILTTDKPTLFRTVICPGPAFQYRTKAYDVADRPHLKVAHALGQSTRRWKNPVYITRTGLSDVRRRFSGEKELEFELSRRGVEIVSPETLPLKEQIDLFSEAPLIIGTVGSALHTALFAPRAKCVIAALTWGRGLENYLMVDAVKRQTSHYIQSLVYMGDEQNTMDVGRTLSCLEDADLVAKRPLIGP